MSLKMEFIEDSYKGLFKVYSRLFSNGYYANNEIKYILNELEFRYNEQDLYRSNNISAMIENLNDSKIANCQNVLETDFDILIDSINRSSNLLNCLLVNSNTEHSTLKSGKEKRENQCLELHKKEEQDIKEIDDKYKCLMIELEQKYNEINN